MEGHIDNVFFIILGAVMVLFNKQLAELSRQYAKAVTKVDSGTLSTRIAYILFGVFFISSSIVSW